MKRTREKLRYPIWALMMVALVSTVSSKGYAADYQYINATDTPILWGASTVNDANWNQTAPWDKSPVSNNPTALDRLDLAADTALQLRNNTTHEVGELTVSGDAGSRVQSIRGETSTSATLKIGTISISDNAQLKLYNNKDGANILVEVNHINIEKDGVLYLGDDANGNQHARGLSGFAVSGTTTVDGTLSSHIGNHNTTGQPGQLPFKFGDLVVNSTGEVILMGNASLSGGDPYLLFYQASSLSGSGGIYGISNTITSGRLLISTLEIATETASNSIFSGVLADARNGASAPNARLALTLSGEGRQTLTGNNTYTGGTRITGGTLILSETGSINEGEIILEGGEFIQNSTVAVDADRIIWTGGGLGGNGVFEGDLTATGSGAKVLNPGSSPGILTVEGDVTLDEFTTVRFELNGPTWATGYDTLSVTGLLDLNDAVLELSLGYAPVITQEFVIANFGTRDGTFHGLNDGSRIDIGSYSFLIHYNDNDIRSYPKTIRRIAKNLISLVDAETL